MEDGSFQIEPGWGPAKSVIVQGTTCIGRYDNRPEDAEAKTTAQRVLSDWRPPKFYPSRPADFADYLKKHRQWIVETMERLSGLVSARMPGAGASLHLQAHCSIGL